MKQRTSCHWYFTFGADHLNGAGLGKYVEIWGRDLTSEQAREIMWALFGPEWAFQYDEYEFLNSQYKKVRHMLIQVTEG